MAFQAQAQCGPGPSIDLRLQTLDPLPRYDMQHSAQHLAQLDHDVRGASSNDFPHTLGLTLSVWGGTHQWSGQTRIVPEGVCVDVVRIEAAFGLKDHAVFLAREIPRGSCVAQDVMVHEDRHVRAHRLLNRSIVQLAREHLQKIAHHGVSVFAPTEEEAQHLINASLDRLTQNFEAMFSQQAQALNAQIDTPQEYRRASLACEGDSQRILKRLSNGF